MTDRSTPEECREGLSLLKRIDVACDHFERSWREGRQPDVDEFLRGWDEPERTLLARELELLQQSLQATPQRQTYDTLASPALTSRAANPRKTGWLPAPIGDYQPLEEIGRGGMGVVYKAQQVSLNRIVALKTIRSREFAIPEEVQRFRSEAEAAARLDHSNIVPIYEVGEIDGVHFFSMAFIEGQSLSERLSNGPLSARDAAETLLKVSQAIEHAHRQGVIHRDLKPGNILLDQNGEPRVSDFGLAKRVDQSDSLTATGQVLGTPSYMPPEQAAGRIDEIGVCADVYALGAVLYASLTGRPPFQGASSIDTLYQVLHQDPVPLRRLNAGVPGDLETICLKCLEKTPQRRYLSAAELTAELRRWLGGEPIQARSTGGVERLVKWSRRRPAAAALCVVSLLALIGLGGVLASAAYNSQLLAALRQADEANLRAEQSDYFRRIALAAGYWQAGDVRRVAPLLEDCPETYRRWEWHYLKRLCHQDVLTIREAPGFPWILAFSPDGNRIAVGTNNAGDGHVSVRNAASGRLVVDIAGPAAGPVYSVAFSPDGRRIASGARENTARIWDAETGRQLLTLAGHAGHVRSVAFGPHGKQIATASAGELKVWDAETGAAVWNFQSETMDYLCLAYSPQGEWIAVSGVAQQGSQLPVSVQLFNAQTGEQAPSLAGHRAGVSTLAFSPDGKLLASGSQDQTVKLWDLNGGEPLTLAHRHVLNCVAFSPDGARLASAGMDSQSVSVWDVVDGSQAMLLKGHTDGVRGVAFSPDGKRLASCSPDRTVKIWDVRHAPAPRTLRGHPNSVYSVAFRPDGKQLASASLASSETAGQLRLWSVETGEAEFTLSTEGVARVAYRPDGRQVAAARYPGGITLWDAASGAAIGEFTGEHSEGINDIAYSPDGRQIATAGGEGLVIVRDSATGARIHKLQAHASGVWAVAYSHDGRRIASAGDGSLGTHAVTLWDAATGRRLRDLPPCDSAVRGIAFSPDDARLAGGRDDGRIRLWNASTGEQTREFSGHLLGVFGIAFSPDGTRLASAGSDQTVRVWDVATGAETLTLQGHTSWVASVAFSPDGHLLATGGNDQEVKLWDARPLGP